MPQGSGKQSRPPSVAGHKHAERSLSRPKPLAYKSKHVQEDDREGNTGYPPNNDLRGNLEYPPDDDPGDNLEYPPDDALSGNLEYSPDDDPRGHPAYPPDDDPRGHPAYLPDDDPRGHPAYLPDDDPRGNSAYYPDNDLRDNSGSGFHDDSGDNLGSESDDGPGDTVKEKFSSEKHAPRSKSRSTSQATTRGRSAKPRGCVPGADSGADNPVQFESIHSAEGAPVEKVKTRGDQQPASRDIKPTGTERSRSSSRIKLSSGREASRSRRDESARRPLSSVISSFSRVSLSNLNNLKPQSDLPEDAEPHNDRTRNGSAPRYPAREADPNPRKPPRDAYAHQNPELRKEEATLHKDEHDKDITVGPTPSASTTTSSGSRSHGSRRSDRYHEDAASDRTPPSSVGPSTDSEPECYDSRQNLRRAKSLDWDKKTVYSRTAGVPRKDPTSGKGKTFTRKKQTHSLNNKLVRYVLT